MTREQKIKILKLIQAGKATISALIPDRITIIVRPPSKGPCMTLLNGKPCSSEQFKAAMDRLEKPTKIKVTRSQVS